MGGSSSKKSQVTDNNGEVVNNLIMGTVDVQSTEMVWWLRGIFLVLVCHLLFNLYKAHRKSMKKAFTNNTA